MTIVTRTQVRAATVRALMLGAAEQEAIDTVAQALNLPPETVAECLQSEEVAA